MAYFANGAEGAVLDEQCDDCPLGLPQFCPVAAVQLVYNYDQIGVPKLREAMSILIGDDGICATRKLLNELPVTRAGGDHDNP